ncbi:MAG TPA: hypothetical protein VFD74_01265 [Thermoleophilia bacterium]|nr:hypothetical protein [Thermoleophilia bacterium]
MQLIVQEGRAVLSLVTPIQVNDDSMRSQTVSEFSENVKAYYRDFELVRVEGRDGQLEIQPANVASIFWVEKGRRYQLKTNP